MLCMVGCSEAGLEKAESFATLFPYQATLLTRTEAPEDGTQPYRPGCGAALVDYSWAVTSKRCVPALAPEGLWVGAGVGIFRSCFFDLAYQDSELCPGYQVRPVARMVHYPTADLALVQLESALTPSDTVQPVEITNMPPSRVSSLLASGWGYPHAGRDYLSGAALTFDQQSGDRATAQDSEISASDSSRACVADIGGPITWPLGFVGVVNAVSDDCNTLSYTDVTLYADWITATTGVEQAVTCSPLELPPPDGAVVEQDGTTIEYAAWWDRPDGTTDFLLLDEVEMPAADDSRTLPDGQFKYWTECGLDQCKTTYGSAWGDLVIQATGAEPAGHISNAVLVNQAGPDRVCLRHHDLPFQAP